MTSVSNTPFERLGGYDAIRGLVDAFYAKVLAVPGLARFFAHADIKRVKHHQTQFIAALLGAPDVMSDEALRAAHQALGITHDDFEQTMLVFRETLEEAGLEAADVGLLVAELRKRAPLVLADG